MRVYRLPGLDVSVRVMDYTEDDGDAEVVRMPCKCFRTSPYANDNQATCTSSMPSKHTRDVGVTLT